MILTIKAKLFELLPGERIKITTDCESLKEALCDHSPNILVDYLNEKYGLKIAHIAHKRKGAENDNI